MNQKNKAAALLGAIRSSKKAKSSRLNGRLGGRPSRNKIVFRGGFSDYRGVGWKLFRLQQKRLFAVVGFRKSVPSMYELLGCGLQQFCDHLEKQFKPGMTWANHGPKGWHVDHIVDLNQYNFSNPAHVRAAFHYTNTQPLWHNASLIKGNRGVKRPKLSYIFGK